MNSIFHCLPKTIEQHLRILPSSIMQKIEEIRIRIGQRIELSLNGKPYYPSNYIVSAEDSLQLLSKVSQFSIYTIEEELRQGYITIEGGHRIGLAGKVITENGKVKAIRDVTSFNIRIARQKLHIADDIIGTLYDKNWLNTIIIGPPQSGKTTLIRDIARIISTGFSSKKIASSKVGIVDERSEIAGCVKGVPQHKLGERVDVLDACPKAEGMMMMIRSMSPEVIIVDEIGRKEDTEAILEAVNAGVSLIVTAHGNGLHDISKRPTIAPLIDRAVFHRFIELSNIGGAGRVRNIRNRSGGSLLTKVSVK